MKDLPFYSKSYRSLSFTCLMMIICYGQASAQIALIQRSISKLDSYRNFSYQYVYKQKEFTDDTTVIRHRDVFQKSPHDKLFGYFFSLKSLIGGNASPSTEVYNGQSFLQLNSEDSTYIVKKIQSSAMEGSLPGYLKLLQGLVEKKPARMAADTLLNGVACAHLVIHTYDTVINKEHFYTLIDIFTDRLSELPVEIIGRSRNNFTGNGVTNYYSSSSYFDYQFDREKVDLAAEGIPSGYHPLQNHVTAGLLPIATSAPSGDLYTAAGQKISLEQFKGKVVMLDFFFIGCYPCMLSLKPLGRLHEKYKDQNLAIISLTHRDSSRAVAAFKKNYRIGYPVYTNAAEMVKSYHVENFPTFYFIDKTGRIAAVMSGYDENFESKAINLIDQLLK